MLWEDWTEERSMDAGGGSEAACLHWGAWTWELASIACEGRWVWTNLNSTIFQMNKVCEISTNNPAGLQRCGKSCRLRWTNYLRPDIKRGKFSLQEEQTIIQLHALLGNRWYPLKCSEHKWSFGLRRFWVPTSVSLFVLALAAMGISLMGNHHYVIILPFWWNTY